MRKIDLNIMGHNKSTMPRGTVDYSKGLIYTIKTGDRLYVGSTTNFRKRKNNHNCVIYKETSTSKLYQTIRENNGEWVMKPYHLFPCNSKLELEIEEERVRRELHADLNTQSCSGINKEKQKITKNKVTEKWRIDNKERIKEYARKWRENNRNHIRVYDNQRYLENKNKNKE